MRKLSLVTLLWVLSFPLYSQRLLSWTPEFPLDNSTLVTNVDCTKGNLGLNNFEGGNSTNVYVHVGVITNLSTGPSDWKYVKFAWGTTDPAAKASPLGSNKYQYTITNVRSFFNVPAAETIRKVCILFRNANGNSSIKQTNSDNSDMYIPVYGNSEFAVRFNLPPSEPRYVPWVEPLTVSAGGILNMTGVSSANANLTIKLNGSVVANTASANTLSASPVLPNICNQRAVLEGNNGTLIVKDSFDFYVAPATVVQALPAGVQEGINYISPTSVTLVLYAPNKISAVVIGDFSGWLQDCAYQMKRTPDNNYYHITLTGLTAGQLYRYQYIVDGTLKVADPYTELVLDPANDPSISPITFPNIPAYPTQTTGIVSTFQTNAPAYSWTATGYIRPDKKNMIIYELLMRDFLASGNWQNLVDTLDYIKRLGINAIEVMPFNEFEGNNSWGYNPDFFFAPDKAYGTKNNLKKFIDEAHKRGIAVIMDAVFNHATGLSPLAQLYWNAAAGTPAVGSPYFNVTATHPFSVFNDFNHSSPATKYHVARFIRHWLSEYRLDGFRWDLSKGFTQTNCGNNINCWNSYDASRVAIWQRYYDSMQVVSPGSYCILEHFANDDEEADLAGRGMLLWGKMTDPYNQNTMGYTSNSDISRAYYKNRTGWTQPHLITYAESHDEERMMYKNLAFGNSSNSAHDVKNGTTAVARMEAMNTFLLMVPGPKMIWEFGELGYDKSIFTCANGSLPSPYGNDVCKLDPKPILWNYKTETARDHLYKVISSLNRLRAAKPNTFQSNNVTGSLGNDLRKSLVISHPDMNVVAVGNFDVTAQTVSVSFPSAGTWYNYLTGETIIVGTAVVDFALQPGEYRVYTSVLIPGGVVNTPPVAGGNILTKGGIGIKILPNPSSKNALIKYVVPADGFVNIEVISSTGQQVKVLFSGNKLQGTYSLQLSNELVNLSNGVYFLQIEQSGKHNYIQFLKTN